MVLHQPADHGITKRGFNHRSGNAGYFFWREVIRIGARGKNSFYFSFNFAQQRIRQS